MKNRFPGTCAICNERVPAESGECNKVDGKWIVTCATACQPKPKTAPAPRQTVGDLSGIMALFATARQHLKFPAIEIDGIAGGIRIHVAGERAKEPGSLTVCTVDKVFGERTYLGRVSKDGTWQPRGDNAALTARLREFAADPAKVAADYGKLHGICCFCRIPLKDERSTGVGYGKICAEHYGLPWGARPTEFAGRAA